MRERRSRSRDVLHATALAAVLAIGVAACSSSGSAGWTYAPEPSATPAPSSSGSAAPGGSGTAASPSGGTGASSAPAVSAAPGSPNPAGSAQSGGGTTGETTVRVVALNIAFDTQTIQAPAGQAFIIEFDNQDQGIPHNIAIRDPSGADAFKGNIITGPAKTTYQVPALTKGTAYTFVCEVHPNMTGTVTVQ